MGKHDTGIAIVEIHRVMDNSLPDATINALSDVAKSSRLHSISRVEHPGSRSTSLLKPRNLASLAT